MKIALMNRRYIPTPIILLALVIVASISAQAPPTLVRTDEVRSMEFHDQITLVGRTEAKIFSRIVAEVSGQVTAINAAEGNPIKRQSPFRVGERYDLGDK